MLFVLSVGESKYISSCSPFVSLTDSGYRIGLSGRPGRWPDALFSSSSMARDCVEILVRVEKVDGWRKCG